MHDFNFSFWFPSYNISRGLVSKNLRSTIRRLFSDLDVIISESSFIGSEQFEIIGKIKNPDHLLYIENVIKQSFGQLSSPFDIQEGNKYLGRLITPGSVGFGIFCDIGIRDKNKKIEILISLHELRKAFPQLTKPSLKQIIKNFGLVDSFPLTLQIESVNVKQSESSTYQISASLSKESVEMFYSWVNDGQDRLIIPKTLSDSVHSIIHKQHLTQFIEEIIVIDPLTTMVVCKKRTRATGLVPKIGQHLNRVHIGVFSLQRLRKVSYDQSITNN